MNGELRCEDSTHATRLYKKRIDTYQETNYRARCAKHFYGRIQYKSRFATTKSYFLNELKSF